MNERIFKFILMMTAVIAIGTTATVLNLSLRKKVLQEDGRAPASAETEAVTAAAAGLDMMSVKTETAPEEEDVMAQSSLNEDLLDTVAYDAEAFGETGSSDETVIEERSYDLVIADLSDDPGQAKESYYSRLSEMDRKLTLKAEEAAKKSAADQKEAADDALKFWDDELNEIYQDLREIMSEEDFIKLREEERAWIRSRDEAASMAASAEKTSNSIQSLAYTRSLIEWTKDRVYELAEIYYEE